MKNSGTLLGKKAAFGLSVMPPRALLERPAGVVVGRWLGRAKRRWLAAESSVRLIVIALVVAVSGCGPCAGASVSATSSAVAQFGPKAAAPGTSAKSIARVAIFGVVTAAGGVPVSDCRVDAFLSGRPQASLGPPAQTNAAGMFALNVELRPGKYFFKASKGKATVRVPMEITLSAGWYKLLHLEFPRTALVAGAQTAANQKGGEAIFGQVTKSDGMTPLGGAFVLVINKETGRPVNAAITGGLGLFALRAGRVAPGKYWILAMVESLHPDVHFSAVLSSLTVGAFSERDIVLRLKAGAGSIAGHVTDSKGRPIGKAEVTLTGTTPPSALRRYNADTNAKGRYELRYVMPGTYVWSLDWKNYSSPPRLVVVGILTRADGVTPLDNMGIRFRRLTGTGLLPHLDWIAVTNRLGTFALRTRLRPGTYVVTACRMPSARVPDPNDNNVAQTTVIIRPSSGRWVVIHLRTPSGSVSGRVLDYSGRPVTRALMGFYGNTNHAVYLAGTDRHGRYSIKNVLPDTYIVTVGAADRVVTVSNGRVKRNFRIGIWPR